MNAIDYILPYAQSVESSTGEPASLTIAQYLQESGDGQPSQLATTYNNPFGVKADSGWSGRVAYLPTTEYDASGSPYTTVAGFKWYDSVDQAAQDRVSLLSSSRYSNLTGDPIKDATLLQQDGYATDPNYGSSLVSIINRYNLRQYDTNLSDLPDNKASRKIAIADKKQATATSAVGAGQLSFTQGLARDVIYLGIAVVLIIIVFQLVPKG